MLEGLETEAQTARFREQELVSEVNKLKVQSGRADQEAVELRALEREASAQRQLLESYLTRYREASSRRDSKLSTAGRARHLAHGGSLRALFPQGSADHGRRFRSVASAHGHRHACFRNFSPAAPCARRPAPSSRSKEWRCR